MDDYHTPETVPEACAILARGPVTIAAGCTDLFPATERKALPGPVLDVTGIATLRGIATTADGIRIGAAATWSEIVRADLPPALDMLKAAAREVGSVQIQNAATLGGNLVNASPAADGVPVLLALDASVTLASVRGERRMPLADFLTGPRRTARRPDELLTGIDVPASATDGQSRFLKLGARRYLVISIAMVAARIDLSARRIRSAAIAVGACSAVATRLPALEAALTGQPAAGAAERVRGDLVTPALAPIDDIRADADYRRAAAVTLVRRAVASLTGTAPERAA